MDYKCKCNDEVKKVTKSVIKYVENKGFIHDVKCEKCGEYMDLINEATGYPSIGGMDRFGRSS